MTAKASETKEALEEEKKEKPVDKKAEEPKKERIKKTKISDAPFVPLKPLPKKKRKTAKDASHDDKKGSGARGGHADKTVVHGFGPETTTDAIREDLVDMELRIPITVKEFCVKIFCGGLNHENAYLGIHVRC